MYLNLRARNFKAVPYLESSALMAHHAAGLVFSNDKPNVIVGPNGSGKSALINALAIHSLSYLVGFSAFDDRYVVFGDADSYWSTERWGNPVFLAGLEVESDFGPAMYYRSNHIPGNETSVTSSMVMGYFNEAREYDRLTDRKSAGQQNLALLRRLESILEGAPVRRTYQSLNWRFGGKPSSKLKKVGDSDSDRRADVLLETYAEVNSTRPVLLLDEPEQSLDAKAEAILWTKIQGADPAHAQIIVATHSLFPIIHPDHFHIIETVPNYVNEVRAML